METTRHFTPTVYTVNDGAVAFHRHERLGIRIPPGGHADRDELLHKAGLREVREEAGLGPGLVDGTPSVPTSASQALLQPRQQMLHDINVHGNGSVGHQHIDHVSYAWVDARDIDPAPGEAGPEVWAWYDEPDLRESGIDSDTMQFALEAIEAVCADERER